MARARSLFHHAPLVSQRLVRLRLQFARLEREGQLGLQRLGHVELVEATLAALDRLWQYAFPGNVRELESAVEQAAALSTSETIQASEVLFDQPGSELPREALGGSGESLSEAVDRAERTAIELAIERSGGDLQQAARRLRVSSTTLWRRMKRLGISR